MCNKMQINREVIDGTTYYVTESRGVTYTLSFSDAVGEWSLWSKRNSLGRSSIGSHRYYGTLEALENSLKAFRGISALLAA